MPIRPVDPGLLARGTSTDPRLGRQVQQTLEGADVAIIGCADDTGPEEIRRWLYRLTPGLLGELAQVSLADLGDVLPESTPEETHALLESAIANAARTGTAVVFLGGGRDLVSASQSALLSARPGRAAIVNVDATLSVQPARDGVVPEASAFRRVLDRWGTRVQSFVTLGAQPPYCSQAQLEYVRSQRGRVTTLDELRMPPGVVERMKRELGATLGSADFATVSVALSAARGSVAPGVSAPLPDGLDAEELGKFCEHAGRQPKVQLLDLTGVSPSQDESERTARLAALCVWRFLLGVANR